MQVKSVYRGAYRCTAELFACYPALNNPFEQTLSLLYILDSCGPALTVTYEALFSFFFSFVGVIYLRLPTFVSLLATPSENTVGMYVSLQRILFSMLLIYQRKLIS